MSDSDQQAKLEMYPDPPASNLERLWTPWRMHYVAAGPVEEGCVFCNRLAEADDVASLILYRGQHAFLIMNLFPYNTGHLMIVPNQHVASPEDLDDETQFEMALLVPIVLRAVRRALNPGGFNLGMNLGGVAGAGIAAHMHQHVVPRWSGDANFMPILSNTKVLPELIPVTYAKIRAEIEREINQSLDDVALIAIDPEQKSLLLQVPLDTKSLRLPGVTLNVEESVSSAITNRLATIGVQGYIAGWAGSRRADGAGSIGLLMLVQESSKATPGHQFVSYEQAIDPQQSPLTPSDIERLIDVLKSLRFDQ